MNDCRVGLCILNLSNAMIIAGACYDLFVPAIPANHAAYLGVTVQQFDARLAELDLAMLRSIGGCLLAIGVASFILTNGPVRRGERWASATLLLLVAIGEGNNAFRMFPFGSPWYGPLLIVIMTGIGVVLVRKSPSGENAGLVKDSDGK